MQIHKLNISGYCFLFALSQIFLCVGALPAGKPKTYYRLFPLLFLCVEALPAGKPKKNAEDKSVIIVGAGVSGLIAAETLRKAGGFSVTVLEATDSIGGRVQTQKIGNHYVEFGAEWVHGNIDNSIYELMEPYGVFINKSESGDGNNGTENFLEMKNIFANQFGEEMVDEFRDQMQKIFNAIYQDDEEGRKLFALTKEKFENKSESVGEFVIALFEEFISENPIHERESVIAAALDFLERKVNIEDSADSWFVTSNAEDGERYEYCDGDQENAWKPTATYFALLKVILGQWETGPSEPGVIIIPPWIQLQSEVVEIQHSSASEVRSEYLRTRAVPETPNYGRALGFTYSGFTVVNETVTVINEKML